MKILVDADACPVVDLTVREAKARNIPVTLITDTAHVLNRTDAEVITVEKGSDSADFKLVNLVQKGDLVVTQDYGLAAMVLAKGGRGAQSKRDDLFRAEHGHAAVYPSHRKEGADGGWTHQRPAQADKGAG